MKMLKAKSQTISIKKLQATSSLRNKLETSVNINIAMCNIMYASLNVLDLTLKTSTGYQSNGR